MLALVAALALAPVSYLDGGATPPTPAATSQSDRLSTDRPSEDAMFGGAETASGAATGDDGGAPPGPVDGGLVRDPAIRDQALLEAKFPYQASEELPPNNPLTIGGLLYLRTQLSASEGQPPSHYLLSAPFLLDTYLDARPNDRVRGYVLVRTEWDPTYNPAQPTQYGLTLTPVANPDFLIDQMWIKFDVAREVFVTVGRQHVKWGTAHFWFPNDLLNPVKLQPLAVFDQRTGVTMVKANLPLSDEDLNLYAMGLFEGLQQANEFGKLGGALRAEYVLGTVELGLDMVSTLGQHNRYGGDISFGIWDFDLYAEGALTNERDNPLWQETVAPDFSPAPGQPASFGSYQLSNPSLYQPQVVAGLNYSLRYGNNRVLTFGGEYFYNGLGYSTPSIYPWLLVNNAATFFYLGQQYAGLYVLADKPGSWYNSTFNFSTLSNLSDHTFISRIDFFQTVLTHLRVEAFVDVHYGGDGEFHYSLNTPSLTFNGVTLPALNVTAPVFDVGLALRLSI